MPTFQKGHLTVVFYDKYDFTRHLSDFAFPQQAGKIDITTYNPEGWEESTPDIKSSSVSMSGYVSRDVDNAADVLRLAIDSTNKNLTAGYAGAAVGTPAELGVLANLKYDHKQGFGGILPFSAGGDLVGYHDGGFFLHPATAETASGNGASVDNGAASANGGVGHLHVLTASGTTPTFVGKVQHSDDDVVWVDLITFTSFAIRGSERIEVAAGTTVHRYTRALWTIGGTNPSFTPVIAFARR